MIIMRFCERVKEKRCTCINILLIMNCSTYFQNHMIIKENCKDCDPGKKGDRLYGYAQMVVNT